MEIESISLQNFRCFGPDATNIELQKDVTAFVGGNGSGKTAVFQALLRLFGVSKDQRTIRPRDFHLSKHQEELQSGALLSLEVVLAFPELQDDSGESIMDAVPEFFLQMAASEPGAPLKVRMKMQSTWTNDGTPDGAVEEEFRWITTMDDTFSWDECPRVQSVQRGSIQLIYVPATRDVAKQVTSLLKGRLWQAAKWSEKLRNTSTRSANIIQKRFEQELPAKLVIERLTKRWKQVYEADTDTTPILRLVENRFEELVRNAKFAFYPDEAGKERALNDLSDGQRSLFHIALTAATLEVERDIFSQPIPDSSFDQEKLHRTYLTILAIEEPENSLSPFFLSRIIFQAREIGQFHSAQVVLSSHSPAILSRIDPIEVRYFRLDDQNRQSFVRKITLPSDDPEASSYVRLAVRAYPELYFARFVILGEGDSERLVIPQISEAMGLQLDPSFVPIVPLGGRYEGHFWRLLNDLQIPYATLLDLDLGRVHGGANAIRNVIKALGKIGNELTENVNVDLGIVDLDDVPRLEGSSLTDGFEQNIWLQTLALENVYFSYPLDLDFAMLSAFPHEYQRPHEGGRGPRGEPNSIKQKKLVTLKTGGEPDLFHVDYDSVFKWYPYLFLSRSKPGTHISALSRISKSDLVAKAPPELKALIEHVKGVLSRDVDE